jgi:hypothetical protein
VTLFKNLTLTGFSLLFASALLPKGANALDPKSQVFDLESNCVVRQFYLNLLADPALGAAMRQDLDNRDLLLSGGLDPDSPTLTTRKRPARC